MSYLLKSGALLAALLLAAVVAIPAHAQNEANMVMSREVTGDYEANGLLSISVTLTADPGTELLALGLRETLPNGWTYQEVTSTTTPPQVTPDQGAAGEIEFAWFTTPDLPYTMTYTARVGDDVFDTVNITGQAEYRLSGEAQLSNVEQTTVEAAPVDPMDMCGCSPAHQRNGAMGDLAVVIGAGLLLGTMAFARSRRESIQLVRTQDRR